MNQKQINSPFQPLKSNHHHTLFQPSSKPHTPFPLLHPPITQLNHHRSIHNPFPIVTPSFLTKHYFIDCTKPEAYFPKKLVDYD
ncbi:FAD-binding domain-containing protein, partial [Bacillus pumilus]|uniref:FAD-binding domain-containing protein n=1 Tax=Bacillus pumilus TaxID=1408 RepID=UPI003703988D